MDGGGLVVARGEAAPLLELVDAPLDGVPLLAGPRGQRPVGGHPDGRAACGGRPGRRAAECPARIPARSRPSRTSCRSRPWAARPRWPWRSTRGPAGTAWGSSGSATTSWSCTPCAGRTRSATRPVAPAADRGHRGGDPRRAGAHGHHDHRQAGGRGVHRPVHRGDRADHLGEAGGGSRFRRPRSRRRRRRSWTIAALRESVQKAKASRTGDAGPGGA